MPLTIFNLSTVDHLYIGKDTVIAFAEQPILDTYRAPTSRRAQKSRIFWEKVGGFFTKVGKGRIIFSLF